MLEMRSCVDSLKSILHGCLNVACVLTPFSCLSWVDERIKKIPNNSIQK